MARSKAHKVKGKVTCPTGLPDNVYRHYASLRVPSDYPPVVALLRLPMTGLMYAVKKTT